MPKVSFTKENMPKEPGGVMKALKEAALHTTPLDDLIELSREMMLLEIKYKMSSEEFFAKFEKGEMGDKTEIIMWAGQFRMYRRLKQKLEKIVQEHYTHKIPLPTS